MKVLFINVHLGINGGGAALGVTQLGESIEKKGIEVSFLSRDDFNVPSKDILPAQAEALFSSHLYSDIPKFVDSIVAIDPDIIHVNCIDRNVISLFDLLKIGKPILWTVRDNTAHTGGCTFLYDCEKYITGCGSCEYIKSDFPYDITSAIFNIKRDVYAHLNNIIMVGPSNWMADNLKRSGITKEKDIRVIPNSVNLNSYYPEKTIQARKELNFDLNKKYILFGAHNVQNVRKGFAHIKKALESVKSKTPVELVTFGKNGENIQLGDIIIRDLGYVNGDEQKRLLYSACDLMLVPSLSEAFGKTVTESMACGTPVVAYNTGGPADIIDHKLNGYLAKIYDIKDLATGINWVINHPNPEELSKNAITKCKTHFNSEMVADKYIEAYKDLLAQPKKNNPVDYDKFRNVESLIKSIYEELNNLEAKYETNFLKKMKKGTPLNPKVKLDVQAQLDTALLENKKLRENQWVSFSKLSLKYKTLFLFGKAAKKLKIYTLLKPIKRVFFGKKK